MSIFTKFALSEFCQSLEIFQVAGILELLIAKRGELMIDLSSLGAGGCFVKLLNRWSKIIRNDFSRLLKTGVRNLVTLVLLVVRLVFFRRTGAY